MPIYNDLKSKVAAEFKLIIMSKRTFAEITTAEVLIQLSKASKKQKSNLTMALARKRTFKKRKRQDSLASQVNRILDKRIESKKVDNNVGGTDILATSLFIDVYSMSQGVTGATRVGVEINPTYMELKMGFISLATTAASGVFIRLMVVQSKEGALVVGDLPTAFGSAPDTDQFNVLMDKIIAMEGHTSTVSLPLSFAWNWSKVLKKSPGIRQTIRYDSATAATLSGGIYVFAISSDDDIDIIDGYVRGL